MRYESFSFAGNRVVIYKSLLNSGLWAVSFNNSHLWMLFNPLTLERELWEFVNSGGGKMKVYRQLKITKGTTLDRDMFDNLVECILGSVRSLK